MKEESSFLVASSQWALSRLFIAFLKEQCSATERAVVGDGKIDEATN
jgi:hypothetical protein